MFSFKPKAGSVVWMEANRLVTGSRVRTTDGAPTKDQLTQALAALPPGPTKWILDDLMAPSVIVKDVAEVPRGGDAREAFFKWKYGQVLAVDGAYSVQGHSLGEQGWLLSGMPLELHDSWIDLAAGLGRPIHLMIPRWLWLYNRAAPTREAPGMLLSLCRTDDGGFSGSIATWGRTLSLVRQWQDSANISTWMYDRIEPTAAFLQRDGVTPAEMLVWGPDNWPNGPVPHKIFQPAIPSQETI
jgi:hypothetical protein